MKKSERLIQFIKDGDDSSALNLVKEILSEISPREIIGDLTTFMRELGGKFEKFEIFLPDLMVAADTFMEVMKVLEPLLQKDEKKEKVKIVLATVKGDIHEIGKNILAIVLKSNGYEIIDAGRDADPLDIIKAAESNNAYLIGLSALMTTTMPSQKELIDILQDQGKRSKFKILVGGAPVSAEWASQIGADGYAEDAFKAVKLVNEIEEKLKKKVEDK
ncbi:corrinoid protein [bacterium]|nr:corrinoid protein [bacterium]MBU4361935.1 corrinoid protein [bacterium]MBU4601498.1 corrinoid protein [bacterium]